MFSIELLVEPGVGAWQCTNFWYPYTVFFLKLVPRTYLCNPTFDCSIRVASLRLSTSGASQHPACWSFNTFTRYHNCSRYRHYTITKVFSAFYAKKKEEMTDEIANKRGFRSGAKSFCCTALDQSTAALRIVNRGGHLSWCEKHDRKQSGHIFFC